MTSYLSWPKSSIALKGNATVDYRSINSGHFLPWSAAEPLPWVRILTAVMNVGICRSATTPAATGTVQSARA
jgi:hypothetical protein